FCSTSTRAPSRDPRPHAGGTTSPIVRRRAGGALGGIDNPPTRPYRWLRAAGRGVSAGCHGRAHMIVDAHVHLGTARWMREIQEVDLIRQKIRAAGVDKVCSFPFVDRGMDANDHVWQTTQGQ